jgi:hypothetical protein
VQTREVDVQTGDVQTGEVERRMLPGGWHSRPLLLPGQKLKTVLDQDAQRLHELGITAHALGQALADVLSKARGSDWFLPFRHSRLNIEVRRRRGFITCPWAAEETEKCVVGKGGRATANEFLLRHRERGLVISGFEISAHLIRDHDFFGGPGTVFRLEPADLALVLNPG